MFEAASFAILAAAMFMVFMVVGLYVTYILDFFVRSLTNNKYVVITKIEKQCGKCGANIE
ncbi:hypothetical protein ACFLRC_05085 [Candidatus Altiarchaeota archaeon]